MAFIPNRRNRPVADAAIAETPVATGQTNDNPYTFDDADVEADYATAEEFRSYDDPDSVQDILRDKPEQFYVGTVEKKKTVCEAVTLTKAQIIAGYMVSTSGAKVLGWNGMCFNNAVYGIGMWDGWVPDGSDPSANPPKLSAMYSVRSTNAAFSTAVVFPNGVYIQAFLNENLMGDDPYVFFSILVEKEI